MSSSQPHSWLIWPLVLLLSGGLPRCAVGRLRNRTCLLNTTYALRERRNVTFGGVSQALRIGLLNWDSAKLESWIYRVIVEEALGVNAEFSNTYDGSMLGFNALAGCKDPATNAVIPHYTGPHVVIGVWEIPGFKANVEKTRQQTPGSVPLDLGFIGYNGYDAMFLSESIIAQAMQREHLPLHIYVSYSHPAFNPMLYFDSHRAIDTGRLKLCSETRAADVSMYFRVFNDTDGVIITEGADGAKIAADCPDGHWWLSPSCRADPSRCIPFVTGGAGYDWAATMQRATAWNMPVAMAVAKDSAAYVDIPRRHRTLFNSFVPDSSFASMNVRKVIWAEHDSLEYSQGILRSEALTNPIGKWGCADLENRSNVGFTKPLAVLRSMSFILSDITSLLAMSQERQGAKDDVLESLACEWLNNNTARYREWIPLETACIEQQGLISKLGAFVDSRSEAQACEWCTPGRISVPVRDSMGTTHRCRNCSAGSFTKSLGMTSCETCEEGQVAPHEGMHACQRCPSGQYAAMQGQSQCDSCLPGFMTEFLGATSAEACICPQGFHRPEHDRDKCLPCEVGMECPAGSDMLGYLPAHTGQYPVPVLKPGFWSSAEDPLSVYRCENDVRCPGGRKPGDACAEKFERQSCAACQAAHVMSGTTCIPCAIGGAQAFLFPILPVLLCLAVVCVIYKFSGQPYATWGSWTSGAQTTVFIVFGHYLVVNIINGAVPQKSASNIFGWFTIFSDVLSVFRPECTGLASFWSQLVLQSHGPAFLLLLYLGLWCGSQVLAVRCPWLRMDANRLLNGYFSLIFAFFARVADMALTILKCSSNPNGLSTLMKDRSITCYEDEWNGMVAVGILAVLLWCVGFGTIATHVIYCAPQSFHRSTFQTRWTFLFKRNRPDVHWWALVILAKGFLLNLGSLFISSSVGQIYWILAVLLLYMSLLVPFRPWRHSLNNTVDNLVNLSLFLTCAITVWFARDAFEDTQGQDSLSLGLLAANLVLAAAPMLPTLATMRYKASLDQAGKDVEVSLIVHALECITRQKNQEAVAFLKQLTEHDFYLLKQTKDMLLTELGHKKIRPGYCSRMNGISSSGQPFVRALQSNGQHDEKECHLKCSSQVGFSEMISTEVVKHAVI